MVQYRTRVILQHFSSRRVETLIAYACIRMSRILIVVVCLLCLVYSSFSANKLTPKASKHLVSAKKKNLSNENFIEKFVHEIYMLFDLFRNLNKLSINHRSYPKSGKLNEFE